MSLRTPLGKVLGLGSAHDGTGHWWMQRVTAVALLLLGLWFVAALLYMDGFTYLEVIRFISQPVNAVLLALLAATLTWHSYLGVQVVIEDYIHTPAAKLIWLLFSRFAHAFLAIASVYAIVVIGAST